MQNSTTLPRKVPPHLRATQCRVHETCTYCGRFTVIYNPIRNRNVFILIPSTIKKFCKHSVKTGQLEPEKKLHHDVDRK